MTIDIGSVLQEWTPDEGEASDVQAYIQVAATIDGRTIRLGTIIGIPDHLQGTARAAGGGVRPYLSTWWADASDWQDVPSDRREEAEEALAEAAPRLWHETMALRGSR